MKNHQNKTDRITIASLATWPIGMVALVVLGCLASTKPTLRTVDDIATDACSLFFSEKQGVSIEDAAKAFCHEKAVVQPFLDAILSAQQPAGESAEKLGLMKPKP